MTMLEQHPGINAEQINSQPPTGGLLISADEYQDTVRLLDTYEGSDRQARLRSLTGQFIGRLLPSFEAEPYQTIGDTVYGMVYAGQEATLFSVDDSNTRKVFTDNIPALRSLGGEQAKAPQEKQFLEDFLATTFPEYVVLHAIQQSRPRQLAFEFPLAS